MKLTKQQTKLHDEAVGLAGCGRRLSYDEQEFVLRHYHPGAVSNITKSGAFFTPLDIAEAAAFYHGAAGGVVDACAGIGALAWNLLKIQPEAKLTCVELNPMFVAVGKAVVPEAEWIIGDAMELLNKRRFQSGLSNPPFGRIHGIAGDAHITVLDALTRSCEQGAIVIVPANTQFERPGWELVAGPFDMSSYKEAWKGAAPKISICDLSRP